VAAVMGLPVAILGAMLGCWVMGVPVSIYTQIGIILLIALSAKNGILIVEFARDYRKAGNPIREAAYEAGHVRLRPILMTSLAFILGNVPLALSTGAGANSRSEMGIAVVFGVLSATAFQIFIVPMLFIVIEKFHFGGFRKKKLVTEED
jgi:HAE1 family hydrophobic/amphiphilic exporter-1